MESIDEKEMPNSEADDLKSGPVQAPVKPLCIKGSHPVKSCRFKYSYMKNWLIPLDGPMSMDHVHFLLDCFVVSAGPVPPQLGRYHPQSDPEAFVPKPDVSWSEDYWSEDAGPSSAWSGQSDGIHSEDSIVRQLSEMRLVLERLLDHHPMPAEDVGEFAECGVCLEWRWLSRRPCCHFAVCAPCLTTYFSLQVEAEGRARIKCCNCDVYAHREEIGAQLSAEAKNKFHTLLMLANQDDNTKTCPRCSHLTQMVPKKEPNDPSITCPSCGLEWCFKCHAPWHESFSCKQFRKGDRLVQSWAKERTHGQLNAQKCPKCKIYIERTTGCDHMHCTRCKTDFCYKCGDKFRYLKFFGDHYSKLSVFGCKYRFKADQPVQRKVIRGAMFGGKLIAAPVVGALALCAGAVAVGVSLFALPVYGGVRLYTQCPVKMVRIPNDHISHSFP